MLLVGIGVVPAAAQEGEDLPWESSTLLGLATGDYGTDVDTDIRYLSFSIGRHFQRGRGEILATFPFLQVTSTGQIIFTGGGFQPFDEGDGGPPATVTETQTGIGDATLRSEWSLVQGTYSRPNWSVFGKVKFPTADETKGFGTGEFDYTVGSALSFFLGLSNWFIELSYTAIGDPEIDGVLIELDNTVGYAAGLGYPVGQWYWSAFAAGRTATREGRDGPLDFYGGFRYNITQGDRVWLYLSGGLSNGSPDYGVITGLSQRF